MRGNKRRADWRVGGELACSRARASRPLPSLPPTTTTPAAFHVNIASHGELAALWDVRVQLTAPVQSAYPAYVMGTLCIVGGITGFARTRSIPSLVAGVG